jgi:sugar lactone lactonase YvrE
MHCIDTARCSVDAIDFDPVMGAVSNRRELVDLPSNIGGRDGITSDEEGYLSVAMCDGWTVRRFRTQRGAEPNHAASPAAT